ncbi:MAG: zinc metalloprotease HtpX [Lysobacterales bacterium 69-70]|nr:protease HtpX [Xanthomonadaceae bacterium]ODU34782.1 MAG: zinc metalloprotease HtpX [Xanthomonadaceae bacterium SCN 69-320]ODV19677.1 MAG: zinc metalloprotease HtpX [Xanthomonadaceae bacterium SCN 69-25]OJY95036.1 MAG: zinc metalloprotease HtpX [Xanthomonadales bacterium 69-70]
MRIVLFLATNLAVLFLLTIVIKLFGLDAGSTRNLTSMLIMAAVIGMGGSFISLALSKWMAKRATGAQVITQPQNEAEQWLYSTVKRQAEKAGIGMPEVAIYGGPEMNAFATGMSRDHALVAVSIGLLQNMDRRQIEAVLAHEISHVANGDMVTMGLIQGVLNTFVIFLARIIGSVVDSFLRGDRDNGGGGIGYFVTVMVAQLVLGVFASMIVMWFSRWREFRADAGSARLEGKDAMISALQRLAAGHGESTLPKEVAAFGIAGSFGKLFASHPPIEDRIAALQQRA